MTQHDMILDYIERFGSISPMEAFSDLGITKLSTRVSEMSRSGIAFNKKTETSKNRLGKPTSYMRYSLKRD